MPAARTTLARLLATLVAMAPSGAAQTGPDELAHIGPGTVRFERSVTATGVRILAVPDAGAGRFRLAALVGAGTRHDPEDQPGMAERLAQALLQSERGMRSLEGTDARIDVRVEAELTILQVEADPRHWRSVVACVHAALQEPALDAPPPQAGPEFPAGALRRFHRERYATGNLLLAFSGRIPVDDATRALATGLAGLRQGSVQPGPTSRDRRLGTRGDLPAASPERPARAEIGYYLPIATAADVTHQLILEQIVTRRLAILSTSPTTADLRLDTGAPHLRIQTRTAAAEDLEPAVHAIHQALAAIPRAADEELEQARTRAQDALRVTSLTALVRIARLAWHFERAGGVSDRLRATLAHSLPGATRAYARRFLTQNNSFTRLPRGGLGTFWIPVLVGGLLVLLLIDRYRGFPIAHSIALFCRLQRAKAQEAMEQDAIPPMSGDELAKRIQAFYEEEDRKPRS